MRRDGPFHARGVDRRALPAAPRAERMPPAMKIALLDAFRRRHPAPRSSFPLTPRGASSAAREAS